ncbi:CD276 antigen-like [Protopterus annectens]|uniref:CD276 antigen-like n=1 Tax=Protopterus annectens TaxID=7888 RepID=UPI001CF94759|nr:CD276 antigen-like [Protopterus annectens]
MVLLFLPLLVYFIGAVTGVRLVVMNEPLQHVAAGKNVTLHCAFTPEENHEPDQLEVQWHVRKRSQWTVLQTYKAKQMANEERQYYGRICIDPNKLIDGIASLQIQNVTLKDSGEYRCIIIDGGGAAFESSQLIVLAPYTDPEITKHYTEAEELVLQCRSQDGYPKGEVQWFDGNGTELQWQGSTEHILTNEGNFQIISNLSLPLNEEVHICCTISHNTNLFEKKVTCHTVIGPSWVSKGASLFQEKKCQVPNTEWKKY